jgi:N-acetyl-anhydromuramyl-L-alanine amidase AmpD
MVAALPPPNFDGPDLTERPPTAAANVALLPPAPPLVDFGAVPRDWTPLARGNGWRWIVIHHSATPTGGAAAFDKIHKAKGWDELGYHFVIGNGTDTRDGQIEVGPRWPRQKWGAHAKTPDNQFNDFGVGVCLVGNFDTTRPSEPQMKSLARLVAHLMKTYRIPPNKVVGHSDTGRATDCPGRFMSVAQVRRLSTQALADAGEVDPFLVHDDTQTAALEMHPNSNP